ncbi:MAG: class I SAM-dependent methyltransferase [Prevotellaceae bacterium]|jgi:hypothetical protein|nr:class I SAM-dependent methyltransferase [Prevotellaceae bacterium]
MGKLIKYFYKNRNNKLFWWGNKWGKLVTNKLPTPIKRLIDAYLYRYVKKDFVFHSSQQPFTDIYKLNFWNSEESKSGTGSTIKATVMIRKHLPLIIERYAIRSMLDVPCGDYNWMRAVEKKCHYIGGDIVPELIENNQKLYASDNVQFKLIDIIKDTLPAVDLIFCKDCLQHLSYANVHKALWNFKSSNSKYLMVTSYSKTWLNHDIENGDYRPLNLRKSPFRLPKPLLRVTEEHGFGYNEIDKAMHLYKLSDLDFGVRGE